MGGGSPERSPALRGSSPFQPPWHDALPTPTGTTTWPCGPAGSQEGCA